MSKRKSHKNRLLGLCLMSMGAGMLLVIIVPGWGFVVAGIMVIAGWYLLFQK